MKFNATKTRCLIAERKLSIDGFSKIADMPVVTLSKILRGENTPQLKTLGKIAHGLGVEPAELLEDERQ